MYTHQGKEYARVTDVIKRFDTFYGSDTQTLQQRANIERKGAIGSRVHKAIEDEVNGCFPIIGSAESPYFSSFLQWRTEVNPRFLDTEQRYFCDDKMLTGQIDAIIHLPGESCPVLLDYKCSASEMPTWVLQAHLYLYLLSKNNVECGQSVLFLKLDPKGRLPRAFRYKFDLNTHLKCLDAVEKFWEEHKNLALIC